MAEYYFDIETYGRGTEPDPTNDKIITVQYQQIDTTTGKPIGDLVILKEWDKGYSEKRIVKEIYEKVFDNPMDWNFIPVGFNLSFEWQFLQAKFKKHLNKKLDLIRFLRPQVDLKHVAVLLNGGLFKGCGLDTFTKKSGGMAIKELYEKKKYKEIEKYIKLEVEEFMKLYRCVLDNLSEFGTKLRVQ